MFRLAITIPIQVILLALPLQASWLKDLEEGKVKAVEEKKDIYLIFTALQVSGACVQLEKRVLSQEVFQKGAGERFILVHLDVPLEAKPGVESPLAGNLELANQFEVEAYPSAFYLNAQGQSYDSVAGGRMTSAEEGLERAKAIIEVLEKAPEGASDELFEREMAELKRLDPDDQLDFQNKRRAEKGFRELEQALKEFFHKDSYDEVVKLVDTYVADFKPEGSLFQKALFPKLAALNHGGQTEAAITVAESVIAVNPESSHGKLASQILARLKAK